MGQVRSCSSMSSTATPLAFGGLINFVLRYLEENGGIPRIRDARLTELIRGGIDPLTGRFLAYLVLSSSSGFLHAHVRHTALAAS